MCRHSTVFPIAEFLLWNKSKTPYLIFIKNTESKEMIKGLDL